MQLSPEQEALIDRVFESYLTEHHQADVLQLIAEPSVETHHAVVVNAMTLFEANMEVGDYFIAYPHDVLAIFDKVLQRKAQLLADEGSSKGAGGHRSKEQRMRHRLHARITGLPVCPELTRVTIPRSRDVGHFLSVTGTVIRTSVAKVLEFERDYICTKCRHVFTVQADFDQYYTFVPPMSCPSPAGCNSCKFTCLSGGSEPTACRDYQEIKIQEQVQRLSVGSVPRSVLVVLENDLVDSCKSGDDVTVYGVMCLRWKPLCDGTPCLVEQVLKANNIEVNNQQGAAALLINDVQKEFEDYWSSYKHDPLAGRNKILLSLCPQVFGMYVIKLAVAMVLAGGVQRVDSSGTKIRGECHMLLVGDPGTGKSQFLKYAAKVMSRSVLTAGIGSTSAGLTVAAVKDGGDWHLEAGALVLADGGLCCIDEFNSIKENDRISIHEAMEQQSISVAKAGIVCKLNTRTTILAATNPKSRYNASEPLCVNVALASPLLSRFDLVLVLLDTKNEEWDRIISSFILEDKGLPADSSGLWPLEKMKAYFSVIRGLQPKVSEEANCILARYYQLQRQSDCRNAARTTVRMLESLSRLAEAHARLMFRETVTIEDAVIALSVMECSMQGGGLLGNVNALLTSFPADPGQQYRTQCQMLLEGLDLPLLYQREMQRLALLKRNPAVPSQHHPDDTDSNKRQNVTGTLQTGWNRFHADAASPSPPSNCETRKQEPESLIRHCGAQRIISSTPEDHRPHQNQDEPPKDQEDIPPSTSQRGRSRGTLADHPVRLTQLSQQHCGEETRGSGDPTGAPMTSTSSTGDQRNLTGSKSISNKAGPCTELHEKLSSFSYNPPKMRQPSSPDESAGPKKKRNKLKSFSKSRSEGEESSTEARVHSKLQDAQSVLSSGKKEVNPGGGTVGTRHPQTQSQNKGNSHDQKDSTHTSPVQSSSHLASVRSGPTNPSVAASAVAKLARFSFSCPAAEPVKKAQPEEENRHRSAVREMCSSPSRSPARKKLRATFQSSSEIQEQETEMDSRTHTAATMTRCQRASDMKVNEGVQQASKALVFHPSSVSIKKRKCFELGPSSHDSLFSGLSALASAAAGNDVFDTDWDQELIKKIT